MCDDDIAVKPFNTSKLCRQDYVYFSTFAITDRDALYLTRVQTRNKGGGIKCRPKNDV